MASIVSSVAHTLATNPITALKSDTATGQPFMFQMFNSNNQMLQTYFLMQMSPGNRYVYSLQASKFVSVDFKTLLVNQGNSKPPCQDYATVNSYTMSNTKASSFVDLNGDCMPDMVIESVSSGKNYLEFYIYTQNGFCHLDKVMVTSSLMATFADVSKNWL